MQWMLAKHDWQALVGCTALDGTLTSSSSFTRASEAPPSRKGLCRMAATSDSMDCALLLPSSGVCCQLVTAARCCGDVRLTSPVTAKGRIKSCPPIASGCTKDRTACSRNRTSDSHLARTSRKSLVTTWTGKQAFCDAVQQVYITADKALPVLQICLIWQQHTLEVPVLTCAVTMQR